LSEYSVNVIEHLKSGVQWIFVPQTLTLFRAEEIERNRYLLQTDVIGAIVEVEGGLMDGRDWLLGFHRYVRPAAVAEDVIHYVETVAQRLKGADEELSVIMDSIAPEQDESEPLYAQAIAAAREYLDVSQSLR
jgi:hypothetical protein